MNTASINKANRRGQSENHPPQIPNSEVQGFELAAGTPAGYAGHLASRLQAENLEPEQVKYATSILGNDRLDLHIKGVDQVNGLPG